MYCAKTMNTYLPVMEGEVEDYYNSIISKLYHKNKRVLFARYHYTDNALVLNEIDGSGPREKAYIL